MLCKIFKSQKRFDTYLYLPKDADYDALAEGVRQFFGTPIFVMELDLSGGRKLASTSASEVIDSITRQGFFLQFPPKHDAFETMQ